MKIDKIVFSSSEEFSPFWNLQSYIWKEIFNIEPVCILWGKVKNTNMSDKYGLIIEKKYNPDLIKSFQITWSKFYHTMSELDTTWMIGDIDLYPLQKSFFIETIKDLNENLYTHLASNVVTNQKYEDNGGYLPAYYHIAKGKTFKNALSLGESSFEEQIINITGDDRYTLKGKFSQEEVKVIYGESSGNKVLIDENEYLYWCTDERYTSFKIFDSHKKGLINFKTACEYQINIYEGPDQTRIDRANYYDNFYHNYDKNMLINNKLIDIHCYRPFEQQKESLYNIIEECYNIKIKI